MGTENGTFQVQAATYDVGAFPKSIATGDFNRDGNLDLVTANSSSNSLSVLLGRGDGTFDSQVTYVVGTSPYCVATDDFDHDGSLDLVAANNGSGNVSVLVGRGDGTFAPQVTYALLATSVPSSVAARDFNDDGNVDLVTTQRHSTPATSYYTVSLLLGLGDGTFESPTPSPDIQPGVPSRGAWEVLPNNAHYPGYYTIPTDLYYACLDGTWNFNDRNPWGMSDDWEGHSDIDHDPDVYVGRVPLRTAAEVHNFIEKTKYYYQHPDPAYFPHIWF